MDNPQTIDEWDVYFSRYSGEQLLSKLKVMNKQSFCKRMRAKGYDLLTIKELLLMAARRVASAGYQLGQCRMQLCTAAPGIGI